MRIHIDVDLSPEEIGPAVELFQALRQLASHVEPRGSRRLMAQLLQLLATPEGNANSGNVESVANNLNALLSLSGAEFRQETYDELFAVVEEVAFSPTLIVQQLSVKPFIQVIARLNEAYKLKFREGLVALVLRVLTQKREIGSDRSEFYLYAEAFAALISLDFVSLQGAMKTIVSLLKKNGTKYAALTMLGTTLHLCFQSINEKCDRGELLELYRLVENITDESLKYDVDYAINSLRLLNLDPAGRSASPNGNDGMHAANGAVPMPKFPPASVSPSPDAGATGSSFAPAKPVVSTAASAAPGSPFGSSKVISPPVAQSPAVVLTPFKSFGGGHTEQIFALCVDPVSEHVVSASKDGFLVTWSPDGQVTSKQSISDGNGGFCCSLDINSMNSMLFAAVKDYPSDNGRIPVVVAYEVRRALNSNIQIVPRGILRRKEAKLMTVIKTANDILGSCFMLGESSRQKQHFLNWYDLNSGAFDQLNPVVSFSEHEDVITSIVQAPSHSDVFLTGSKDFTIRLWDIRQRTCAATFGLTQREMSSFPDRANVGPGATVASLDAKENTLISVDLDGKIMVWDLRKMLSQPQVTTAMQKRKTPTPFKVAIGSNAYTAAIPTLEGLKMYHHPSNQLSDVASPGSGGEAVLYNDIKWSERKDKLYAGRNTGHVDVYSASASFAMPGI